MARDENLSRNEQEKEAEKKDSFSLLPFESLMLMNVLYVQPYLRLPKEGELMHSMEDDSLWVNIACT